MNLLLWALGGVLSLRVTFKSQLDLLINMRSATTLKVLNSLDMVKSIEQVKRLSLPIQRELSEASKNIYGAADWCLPLDIHGLSYRIFTFESLSSQGQTLDWDWWMERLPFLSMQENDHPGLLPSEARHQILYNTVHNAELVSTGRLCQQLEWAEMSALQQTDGWLLIDGECLANMSLTGRLNLKEIIGIPVDLYDNLSMEATELTELIRMLLHRIVAIRVGKQIGLPLVVQWRLNDNRLHLCNHLEAHLNPFRRAFDRIHLVLLSIIDWLYTAPLQKDIRAADFYFSEKRRLPSSVVIDFLWQWFAKHAQQDEDYVTRLNLLALDDRPEVSEERLSEMLELNPVVSNRALQDLALLRDHLRPLILERIRRRYTQHQLLHLPGHIARLLKNDQELFLAALQLHYLNPHYLQLEATRHPRLAVWNSLRRFIEGVFLVIHSASSLAEVIPSVFTRPFHLVTLRKLLIKALALGLQLPVTFHPALLHLTFSHASLSTEDGWSLANLFLRHELSGIMGSDEALGRLHRHYLMAHEGDIEWYADGPIAPPPYRLPPYEEAEYGRMAKTIFTHLKPLDFDAMADAHLPALLHHFHGAEIISWHSEAISSSHSEASSSSSSSSVY